MITKAMILAAGLGTRMRPVTERIPKPLVKVHGKALIDHKLDAARRAGINTIIVNVHYLADQLENHLNQCNDLEIILSDERDQLMDSGGGIYKAMGDFADFGDAAILIMNCDTFWIGDKIPSLLQLYKVWDEGKMDLLLALADVNQAVGFHGAGDFFVDNDLSLTRRGTSRSAPFAFAGDYIVHPRIFHDLPTGPFSSNLLFDRAINQRRLCGIKLQGTWLHVGTPETVIEAEQAIVLHGS
jgi:MurNAc alpha-1-phosphate uridylyltransferase